MRRNIRMRNTRKKALKGFTLIELIAVVSLLMLIATLSFPKYSQIVDEQRLKLDAATAVQIGSIAESFYIQNKSSQTIDENSIKTYIENTYGEKPKSKYMKDGEFKVTLTDKGKANVSLGTINFVVAGIFNEESVMTDIQQGPGDSDAGDN